MEHVVIMSLLVVQAAGGVYTGLLQQGCKLVQLRAGYAADVEQTVAVCTVQHFHDVGGVGLAGKVEVYFHQVVVGIVYLASGTDDGQSVGFYFQVTEACL